MKNIEKYIDHTLLKPDATEAAIGKVCAEAIEHGFKSLSVNPARIAFAANQRDEVRDLHDVAGALGAQPGM